MIHGIKEVNLGDIKIGKGVYDSNIVFSSRKVIYDKYVTNIDEGESIGDRLELVKGKKYEFFIEANSNINFIEIDTVVLKKLTTQVTDIESSKGPGVTEKCRWIKFNYLKSTNARLTYLDIYPVFVSNNNKAHIVISEL